ncbi:hypothetical protein KOAAANKH_02571 [Brevundimonas sp. NIBR10]|uniref:hypothetical protein n=1 Tax=Brevundimonas sp. NIBR10 TaxID=3015997 RepID=UPI0022F194FB|nr:hypothetical protein [Brevundimonas sp. NIBR10]WGM47689.1 hypothetical protein KOAAANKH_02571 [Brevundimonas sp. NIBR10]
MKTQPSGLELVTSIEDIETDTLVGDVKDLILQEMRDAKDHRPWTERNEDDQDAMIDRADRFATSLVAKVVREIAIMGRPSVTVQIKEWKVGDALKIATEAIASEGNAMALLHGGKIAHLVFGDIAEFKGERAEIVAVPDQADLHDEDGVVFDNTKAAA